MKNRKGFTLIELLVVVLIIGILASVALPQYEKAVEKSRMAEALTVISSLRKAVEVAQLANPGESITKDMLDIDLPNWETKDWEYAIWGSVVFACRKKDGVSCGISSGKIKAIKEMRNAFSLGLKNTKDCIEGKDESCFLENGACSSTMASGSGKYSIVSIPGKMCCGGAKSSSAAEQSLCTAFNKQQ